MSDRNVVLAINDVEPGLVQAVKRHANRLGKELKGIVLVDSAYEIAKARAKDHTGFFKEIICDFDDPYQLQKVLKPYAENLLVATCRHESSILSFRKVLPFLPYVETPSESALLWSTQKQMMRDRLHSYDESLVPKYRYLDELSITKVNAILRELDFPIIVKPIGLEASVLVTICHNKRELMKCLQQTFEVIESVYSRYLGRGNPSVLLEETMQGDMYSVDAYVSPTGEIYCLPPVQVITAHSIGLPGFYSYRHIVPTGLTPEEIAGAYQTTKAAIRALNLSASTAHVELFLTKDGWKIIELGPRIGGYREALYREAFGIDHYYNDLAVRMGDEPEIPTEPLAEVAGMNMYADEEGRIESITGFEEAKQLPSVVELAVHAKPGDLALFAGNGGKLIVDGILKNKDREALERDVAKVRELIQIKVGAVHPDELILE